MGERKPQNKYYPPDFDPSKIPRPKQPKNRQITVRMMLPMSVRCGTCGAYISKGTKFNSRKEDSVGAKYLGIQIFRFYIKCTRCSAEITFKTDPKNSDYTVESGASRNFEPWRKEEEVVDGEKRRREAEELGDAMRAMENRANGSKRDMERIADLEELRSMNSRRQVVSIDQMLEIHLKEGKTLAELDEEDEELVKSTPLPNSNGYVKWIADDDDEDDDNFGAPGPSSESVLNPTDVLPKTNGLESSNKEGNKITVASNKMPKFIVKPKPTAANPRKGQKAESAAAKDSGKAPVAEEKGGASEEKTNVIQSLCQYDSDNSDE